MQEERKRSHHISERATKVITGIFLILLSAVLALNVGYIARVLFFPLLFIFGMPAYLILLYFLVDGFALIIKGKSLKLRNWSQYLGIALFFIGTSMLSSCICYSINGSFPDISTSINLFFKEIRIEYLTNTYLNIFTELQFGGGIIGATLVGLTNGIHIIFSYTIASIVIALSIAAFIFSEMFIRLKKNKSTNNTFNEKPLDLNDLAAEESSIQIVPEDTIPIIEREEDISLENPSQTDISEPILDTVKENTQSTNSSMLFNSSNYGENEEFKIAKLPSAMKKNSEDLIETETSNNNEPSDTYFYEEQNSIELQDETVNECEEATNVVEEEPISEEIVEHHIIDESLATAQPEFISPKSEEINVKPVQNTPILNEISKETPKVKKKIKWIPPSTDLLVTYETSQELEANLAVANERKEVINAFFNDFAIGAECVGFTIGPSVTRYDVQYQNNVSSKNVSNLVPDLSRRLKGVPVRFVQVVSGSYYSGFEIPNAKITTVSFKEIIESLPDVKKNPLCVGFGKDISGEVISANFNEFPHLLVAGTTGSGKSIYIHSVIATLIMRVSPDDLKIVLVDPKQVEMTKYRDMPHLLCPIITQASQAKVMLSKLVDEMNNRYSLFYNAEGSSNIEQYNEWALENGKDKLPYVVVVLDEYADLVDTCKEISQPVVSIAQKARAAGIHLLISTQRPSTNVITGVIKGNLPTHVALVTASSVDSTVILGEGGAEKLLGKGDMLVQSPLVSRNGLVRLQGCYVQNKELFRIVGYLKEHYETNYDENYMDLVDHSKDEGSRAVMNGQYGAIDDEEGQYQAIKEWVMTQQFASISKIQRSWPIGFNKAGKIMIRLQSEGIVAEVPVSASRGCEVLVHAPSSETANSPVTSSEQSELRD